ncbi:MAG: hypothetical protein K8T89_13950 [Planctomycetes bacterium]|nr:hypothetical protein [Planctomycetota bacterium]
MIRRIGLLALILTATGFLESQAVAQVIIVPARDPIKEREEYNQRLATDWVRIYLGRKPTEKELALMMQRLRTGASPAAVQASILSSDEYYKKYGNTQAFINGVFQDVLGRKATAAEILQLSAKVNGMGRARFAAEFVAANQLPLVNPVQPTVIIVP